MRVYEVPPDRASALVYSLNQALFAGPRPDGDSSQAALGKVSLGGHGQLIVVADASLHPSIERSLQAIMAATPAGGAAEPQLRLRFWSVDFLAGGGSDAPALRSLKPALDELRSAAGQGHFALRDHLESVSAVDPGRQRGVRRHWDSVRVGAEGEVVEQALGYTIEKADGAYQLALEFNDRNFPPSKHGAVDRKTTTSTSLVLGQTLVLASQPFVSPAPSTESGMRYYIIRVDPVASSDSGDAG